MTRRHTASVALALPLLLSGCSLLPTTRKLPVPKVPLLTRTVPADQLVAQLNERWNALQSLTATVEIKASESKALAGTAKDFPSIRGYILMRKPGMLRVRGQVPVLGTVAFDMASDGQNFTLSIPMKNRAIRGSNKLKKRSENQFENLRPDVFFDAMLVRGLDPEDEYMVTAETVTVEDAARKHLYQVPEYKLTVMHRKPGSLEKTPLRVITFHRDDLLPYQQDLYDAEGNLETQVKYADYHEYEAARYPSVVVITRPKEETEVTLFVDKVTENVALRDDQFTVKIPDGTPVQNLE